MIICYVQTYHKGPTTEDIPGDLQSVKQKSAALIGLKLNSISPDRNGVYVSIYDYDGVLMSELYRIGNDSFCWVDKR